MHPVRVVYRKYDDSLHWHQWAQYLDEDEHGLWLGAPPHSKAQRGDEPPVIHSQAHVLLFPRDAWWTAVFNDAPARTEIYCDITTPPEIGTAQVTMVDLDLDVLRRRDGSVLVDDEDEFAEHQVKYGYSPDVIEQAQASCDWLAANVAVSEPFMSAFRPYLERMAQAPSSAG
ncbi:MAG: DUF402 domain-containing protein [Kribbellaceae bacterium]